MYFLTMMVSEHLSHSGCFGEEKFLPMLGIESQPVTSHCTK